MLLCSFAAMALTLAGCRENREKDDPADGHRTIVFRAGTPDVKTAFGESDGTSRPTLWTANDSKVKITLNFNDPVEAGVVPSADFRTATFSAEMDPVSASSPYTFYAVSPASAAVAVSPSRSAWRIKIPSVQTPVDGSVDEGAQILVAKSTAFTTIPDEVSLHFGHATAYGLLSLTNLSLGEATVQAVELTCTTPIVGEFYCADGAFTAIGESSTLRVVTNRTDAVWFACAPVSVAGETLKVTVITNQGALVKEVTFPSGRQFTSGKIAKFSVDMTGVEFGSDDWTLVTANNLKEGDEVLILDAGEQYVLSTTQNTNNRAAAAIPSGSIVNHVWKTPISTAQVLTLVAGKNPGTWAFSTGDGYLANRNGTNNTLVTVTSINNNSSFAIDIAPTGGASIEAEEGDRYILRFNLNSNSPIFACYGSGQQDVCLFRKGGGSSIDFTDDPLLAQSRYGAYLSDGQRLYNEGEDQYSREYNGGVLTFAILHPADNEQLEITGYRKTLVKGDEVIVSVKHRRGLTTLRNASYTMSVVGEDGSKVWLGDGSGNGFIIKK